MLTRISVVLGIHQHLGVLFADEHDRVAWLRQSHDALVFGGHPPFDLVVNGTQDGLMMTVGRFLDAARGGLYMPPNAADTDFTPDEDAEIIFQCAIRYSAALQLSFLLIQSRYPPIGLFDTVSTAAGAEAVMVVNFWQPSGCKTFRAPAHSELFPYKFHSFNDYIVSDGVFSHSPNVSMAWDALGAKNSVVSLADMRRRIAHYRRDILT